MYVDRSMHIENENRVMATSTEQARKWSLHTLACTKTKSKNKNDYAIYVCSTELNVQMCVWEPFRCN